MGTIAQRDLYKLIDEANGRANASSSLRSRIRAASTPQQRGAKMLFFEMHSRGNGWGGCIEAEVWAEARDAQRSARSALHHFSLTAEEASEEGMVCAVRWIFLSTFGSRNGQLLLQLHWLIPARGAGEPFQNRER